MIRNYLKLMRVKHYIKNLLIFAPLIFSGDFFYGNNIFVVFGGSIAFSLLSSVVYIINDLHDVEKDRKHPSKCKRPLASGSVSRKQAYILAICLYILSLLCHFLLNASWLYYGYLMIYLIINFAYSFGLKDHPVIDIAILSAGFLLRVLYGGAIVHITVSNWLLLTVISLSFYLSLGKRRNELARQNGTDTRKVLAFYNNAFLDKNMYMFLSLANAFYALWSAGNQNSLLIWTVPIVMLICLRYSLDIEGDSEADPVEVLLGDRTLISFCLLYGIVIMCILYL